MFDVDRKFRPSGSLFGITRQSPVMPNSDSRDGISIRTSHPCKIDSYHPETAMTYNETVSNFTYFKLQRNSCERQQTYHSSIPSFSTTISTGNKSTDWSNRCDGMPTWPNGLAKFTSLASDHKLQIESKQHFIAETLFIITSLSSAVTGIQLKRL